MQGPLSATYRRTIVAKLFLCSYEGLEPWTLVRCTLQPDQLVFWFQLSFLEKKIEKRSDCWRQKFFTIRAEKSRIAKKTTEKVISLNREAFCRIDDSNNDDDSSSNNDSDGDDDDGGSSNDDEDGGGDYSNDDRDDSENEDNNGGDNDKGSYSDDDSYESGNNISHNNDNSSYGNKKDHEDNKDNNKESDCKGFHHLLSFPTDTKEDELPFTSLGFLISIFLNLPPTWRGSFIRLRQIIATHDYSNKSYYLRQLVNARINQR